MRARAYSRNNECLQLKELCRVLETFDKEKISSYLTKVLNMPSLDENLTFWPLVFKALYNNPYAKQGSREYAEKWLHDHGMSTGEGDDNVPEIGKQLVKGPTRFMFGEPIESYSYGDLRIVRTCGRKKGAPTLVVSFSQIGGKDPGEKDMIKVAKMLGVDMDREVKRYTNTSYDPYFRHTFYFVQMADEETCAAFHAGISSVT